MLFQLANLLNYVDDFIFLPNHFLTIQILRETPSLALSLAY